MRISHFSRKELSYIIQSPVKIWETMRSAMILVHHHCCRNGDVAAICSLWIEDLQQTIISIGLKFAIRQSNNGLHQATTRAKSKYVNQPKGTRVNTQSWLGRRHVKKFWEKPKPMPQTWTLALPCDPPRTASLTSILRLFLQFHHNDMGTHDIDAFAAYRCASF